jgi:hypothetical protein
MRECEELKLTRDLFVVPEERREEDEALELRGLVSRECVGVSYGQPPETIAITAVLPGMRGVRWRWRQRITCEGLRCSLLHKRGCSPGSGLFGTAGLLALRRHEANRQILEANLLASQIWWKWRGARVGRSRRSRQLGSQRNSRLLRVLHAFVVRPQDLIVDEGGCLQSAMRRGEEGEEANLEETSLDA